MEHTTLMNMIIASVLILDLHPYNISKSNINNVEDLKGDVMLSDEYKNAQVVTSDGKNIGNVKSSDGKSLVVFKKGFLRDEEFHVAIASNITL